MNDEGDAIVNAGRLTEPEPDRATNDTIFERLPNVVIGAGGKISLVYLARTRAKARGSCSRPSSKSTRRPGCRESAVPRPAVCWPRTAPSPLVVSADGECVYAIDGSGQIVKHSIPR